MDDLKKRAYLARYLVRIDIPPEQQADQDISELNETVGVALLGCFPVVRVSHTYVHARKSLNPFNSTFEVNKCFDGENKCFSTI